MSSQGDFSLSLRFLFPFSNINMSTFVARYILLHLAGVPLKEIFIYQGDPLELRAALTEHIRHRVANLKSLLFPESSNVFVRMWRRLRGVAPRVSANRALYSVAGHLAPPNVMRHCEESLSTLINRGSAQTGQDRMDVLTLSRSLSESVHDGAGPVDLTSLTSQRRRVENDLVTLLDRQRGIARPADGDLLGHDDLHRDQNPRGFY